MKKYINLCVGALSLCMLLAGCGKDESKVDAAVDKLLEQSASQSEESEENEKTNIPTGDTPFVESDEEGEKEKVSISVGDLSSVGLDENGNITVDKEDTSGEVEFPPEVLELEPDWSNDQLKDHMYEDPFEVTDAKAIGHGLPDSTSEERKVLHALWYDVLNLIRRDEGIGTGDHTMVNVRYSVVRKFKVDELRGPEGATTVAVSDWEDIQMYECFCIFSDCTASEMCLYVYYDMDMNLIGTYLYSGSN